MRHSAMTDTDHRLVAEAVAAAEQRTDGEIVTIVARTSDAYHDVGLHWAVACTFLTIAAVAARPEMFEHLYAAALGDWDRELPLRSFLLLLLGHAILTFLVARYVLAIPALRLALTPGATRNRRVRRRAVALFRAAAEARTRGRTGVLVYLSLAEHRAEIVADSGISSRVDPDLWGAAMADMLVDVKAGRIGAGLAKAVTHVGTILAAHVPPSTDNPDELPNRLIEL